MSQPKTGRLKLVTAACLLSLMLAGGCAATDKKDADGTPVEKQIPVERLYNKAASTLDGKEYFLAAKQFDEVDRQYPYSQWATRAQMMAGYAHYKNLKYDDVLRVMDILQGGKIKRVGLLVKPDK